MRSRLPVLMCPASSIEHPLAELIGVVREDGLVQFTKKALPLTAEFRETAAKGRHPDRRFRFASPCAQKNCIQWKEGLCALGEDVVDTLVAADADEVPCPIRPNCRWYHQRGEAACRICPQVIYRLEFDDALMEDLALEGPE